MNKLTINLIEAAKRKKTIEYKDFSGDWQPFTPNFPDILVDIANTPEETEIRIQPRFAHYRPYLHDVCYGNTYGISLWCSSEGSEEETESGTSFIKWLDVKTTLEVDV